MSFLKVFQTKTAWTGLALVGYGIYNAVTGETGEGVNRIIEGAGLIFLRQGVQKLQNTEDDDA